MYRVVVVKGPDVLHVWDTPESMIAVLGLDPGLLYTVAVTPCACGRQGHPVYVPVRTGETHVITAERTFSTVICLCFFKVFGRALTSCAVVTLPVCSITTLFTVDAATLNASARLTNIRFTADLQDPSSQAYKNLTGSILAEVSFIIKHNAL